MKTFADLPQEIVLQIWQFIAANDVGNFALVSQQTRTLGAKRLEEHAYSRKTYSDLTLGHYAKIFRTAPQNPTSKSRHLIDKVWDVLTQRDYVDYVRVLCIQEVWEALEEDEDNQVSFEEDEQRMREVRTDESKSCTESII